MSSTDSLTVIEEEQEALSCPSFPSHSSTRTKELLNTFWDAYNQHTSLQHSIQISSSNPQIIESLIIEMNRLREFITKSYACLSHTVSPESKRIIIASEKLVYINFQHLTSRLQTIQETSHPLNPLNPLSPPPFICKKKKRKLSQDDVIKRQVRFRKAETRPRQFKQLKPIRFCDEKQIKDCLRRFVTIFYIRDYLLVQCKGISDNPTLASVMDYIITNAHLFDEQLEDYGVHYLSNSIKKTQETTRWSQHPAIVKQFAEFVISEIQDLITYIIYCLRENELLFNTTIPPILRDRIRVRISTTPNSSVSSGSSTSSTMQYIELAKKTSLAIFDIIQSRSPIRTSTSTSDDNTDSE